MIKVAESGVRVNSVNPGVIETAIFSGAGFTEEQCKQYFEIAKVRTAFKTLSNVVVNNIIPFLNVVVFKKNVVIRRIVIALF